MWNTIVVGEEGEGRGGALRACVGERGGEGCWVFVERKRERGRRKRRRPFFLDGVGEREEVAGTEPLGWRINVRRESFISSEPLSPPLLLGEEDRGEAAEVDAGRGSGTTV